MVPEPREPLFREEGRLFDPFGDPVLIAAEFIHVDGMEIGIEPCGNLRIRLPGQRPGVQACRDPLAL